MYVRTLNYGLDSKQELNVDRSTFTILAFELEENFFSVYWTYSKIFLVDWGSFKYVVGFSLITHNFSEETYDRTRNQILNHGQKQSFAKVANNKPCFGWFLFINNNEIRQILFKIFRNEPRCPDPDA